MLSLREVLWTPSNGSITSVLLHFISMFTDFHWFSFGVRGVWKGLFVLRFGKLKEQMLLFGGLVHYNWVYKMATSAQHNFKELKVMFSNCLFTLVDSSKAPGYSKQSKAENPHKWEAGISKCLWFLPDKWLNYYSIKQPLYYLWTNCYIEFFYFFKHLKLLTCLVDEPLQFLGLMH